MKKLLLFLLITNCSLLTVSAQTQFQLTVGGSSGIGDFCTSIVQTTDGGYAMSGYNNFIGYADMYIVKLNGIGALQWTRTLHQNGMPNGVRSIVQTTDGGFVMASPNRLGDPFKIVKLDGSGAMQWAAFVGGVGFSYSIVQSTEGGYAAAGRTNSFGAGGDDVYIVKLDTTGVVQWTRTIGGSGNDLGYSIVQAIDGGYAIGGQTNSFGAGGDDIYIVKLDNSGVVQWTRSVGGSGTDLGYSIVRTNDGGYAVTGQTNSFGAGGDDVYIVKLNSTGIVQWTRTVGGSGRDQGRSIVQTTDGGYAIGGYTNSFGAGNDDFYIVKLDSSGVLQWTRTVGGSSSDQGYSIVQTTDGGYAIGGHTASFGGYKYYLVKLDGNGNTCNNSSSGGIAGSGGISNSGGISGSGSLAIQPQSMVSGTLGILTNICSVVGISGSGTLKPNSYELFQNYPNPFNPNTKIKFSIPKSSFTKLNIYDGTGKDVTTLVNEQLNEGTYSVDFDGSMLSSGLYFYQLLAGDFTETGKMLLVK